MQHRAISAGSTHLRRDRGQHVAVEMSRTMRTEHGLGCEDCGHDG